MMVRRRGNVLYPLLSRQRTAQARKRALLIGLLSGFLLATAGSAGLWYAYATKARLPLIDLLSGLSMSTEPDICINGYAYKIKPDGRLAAIGFIEKEDRSLPYPVEIKWLTCGKTLSPSLP